MFTLEPSNSPLVRLAWISKFDLVGWKEGGSVIFISECCWSKTTERDLRLCGVVFTSRYVWKWQNCPLSSVPQQHSMLRLSDSCTATYNSMESIQKYWTIWMLSSVDNNIVLQVGTSDFVHSQQHSFSRWIGQETTSSWTVQTDNLNRLMMGVSRDDWYHSIIGCTSQPTKRNTTDSQFP